MMTAIIQVIRIINIFIIKLIGCVKSFLISIAYKFYIMLLILKLIEMAIIKDYQVELLKILLQSDAIFIMEF